MRCELKKRIIVFCILQIASLVHAEFGFGNSKLLDSLLMLPNEELKGEGSGYTHPQTTVSLVEEAISEANTPNTHAAETHAAEDISTTPLCDCKTGTPLDVIINHQCGNASITTTQTVPNKPNTAHPIKVDTTFAPKTETTTTSYLKDTTLVPHVPTTPQTWKLDTTLIPHVPTTPQIWKLDTTLVPTTPQPWKLDTTVVTNEHRTTRDVQMQTTITPVRTEPMACHLVGETKANIYNCNTFYVCAPTKQGLEFVQLLCPVGTAYSAELKRCARDISTCSNDFPRCTNGGTFTDGKSTSTYILCVPSLSDFRIHKYRVRCASYEVFVPSLGSCLIDAAKVQAGNANLHEIHDLDIIKAELEELKIREKALRKEEKRREKIQKKLEKELVKKAIKDAIERAELAGMDSDEIEDFDCLRPGLFPSVLGKNFYHECVLKKGKLKSKIRLCPAGTYFSSFSCTCVL